jgi:hypothetical protein
LIATLNQQIFERFNDGLCLNWILRAAVIWTDGFPFNVLPNYTWLMVVGAL